GWAAATNWFVKKRGIALGILSGAIGAGGMLIYLVNWLIGTYGWRTTLVIIGIGFWVIGIPSALVVRHSPEPYGLSPDGDRPSEPFSADMEKLGSTPKQQLEGLTVFEAMKTKIFWIIALMVSISSAGVHAVIVHVMPHFISLHLSRDRASLAASFLVVVSVIGRFGLGWLGNRFDQRRLMAFALALQGLGLFLLAGAETFWQAFLFIITFGPGYGGVITLRLTMLADYFGRKAFGAIQGLILAITVIGSMASPVLTGMVFDAYGSYRLAWIVLGGLILASVPLAFIIRSPRETNPPSSSLA
ncbi:MAG: MFS transporter, partial [Pseudomonadota bacterium]